MTLGRVPDDPFHRMHCTGPRCGITSVQFLVDIEIVEVRATASGALEVMMPDGTRPRFRKGEVDSVQCPRCGTKYPAEQVAPDL
jgi:hypothetical protein